MKGEGATWKCCIKAKYVVEGGGWLTRDQGPAMALVSGEL